MRFLAFEESPIVPANEVRRARHRQGHPRGSYETLNATDRGLWDSRIVGRRQSGLAAEVEGNVLDVGVLWEVEHYISR